MSYVPSPVYPIKFDIKWQQIILFDIDVYDQPLSWKRKKKCLYVYLPVLYVYIYKRWITEQHEVPYASSCSAPTDEWDEIPF